MRLCGVARGVSLSRDRAREAQSAVEPLAHCLGIHNVFREDVVKGSLSNDEALDNAPRRDGEFFSVPKVLDDAGA